MTHPSPTDLLAVWERASAASPAERPLLLLAGALPGRPTSDLAGLPVAERDALLLDLRESLFGTHLRSVASCPKCSESIEFAVRTDVIRLPPRPRPESPLAFEIDGFRGTFRLPVSGDWASLPPDAGDPARLRSSLAARCLVHFEPREASATPSASASKSSPPPAVLEAVADAIARHDADAHLEFSVRCPSCQHEREVLFDVAAYLWREIDAHCQRLLVEVHQLASAYGWTEKEILDLGPVRRRRYLELVHEYE